MSACFLIALMALWIDEHDASICGDIAPYGVLGKRDSGMD